MLGATPWGVGGRRERGDGGPVVSGSFNSHVISTIALRNPLAWKRRCAASFRSAVERTTRGTPRDTSCESVTRSSRRPTPHPRHCGSTIRSCSTPRGRGATVVVAFDRSVGVSDHGVAALGHQYGDGRILELGSEERGVIGRRPVPGRQEAKGVEVVMLLDQERAEPPEDWQIPAGRAPDHGPARWSCTHSGYSRTITLIDARSFMAR
jgi:hypothetical protein